MLAINDSIAHSRIIESWTIDLLMVYPRSFITSTPMSEVMLTFRDGRMLRLAFMEVDPIAYIVTKFVVTLPITSNSRHRLNGNHSACSALAITS